MHECLPDCFISGDWNGGIAGVVLVHSVHGLMYSVWICVAAFSAIDPLLARASA